MKTSDSIVKIAVTARGRHRFWGYRRRDDDGTMRILARIRHKLTRNAIQKAAAIAAVTMKLRGDTSQDVSATIRPNAKQLNMIAKFSRTGMAFQTPARRDARLLRRGRAGGVWNERLPVISPRTADRRAGTRRPARGVGAGVPDA